ncbi:MAG: hypothetical protein KatS3mg111_3878 [Pirellulaceae bacterium]|nr:MAG: hypothetical protein KatS3mg111_3878 [Pirellulaceae bacterium]
MLHVGSHVGHFNLTDGSVLAPIGVSWLHSRSTMVCWLAYVVLLCAALCQPVLAQGTTARITIPEYKRLLAEQRRSIKSMRFTVSSELKFDKAVERAGLLRGAVLSSKIQIYWSGEKHRSERRVKSINSNGMPATENTISVFDGAINKAREVAGQKYILQKELSNLSVIDEYRNALLWPISPSELDWCRKSPSETYFLPYFLNEEEWDVLPELAARDSIDCVVFRKRDGTRELWLDPRRNYCLIYYWQKKPLRDTLRWSNAYSAHEEVLTGVYLPTKIVITHEMADPSNLNHRLGNIVNEIEITNLSVNDVPDSIFTLGPEPGDWVIDNIEGKSYRFYPNGDTTLEDSVNESIYNFGKRFGVGSMRSIFFALNIILMLALAGYYIGRAFRRNR